MIEEMENKRLGDAEMDSEFEDLKKRKMMRK